MRHSRPVTILLVGLLCTCLGACDDSNGGADADLVPDAGADAADTVSDTVSDTESDTDSSAPLEANAGASRYALVGESVTLDGSASTGAVSYQWHFGDGTGWDDPRETPTAEISFDEPGRYRAVLTVYDAYGRSRSDGVVISVTEQPTFSPQASSSIITLPDNRLAIVSPDSDELAVYGWSDAGEFELVERIATCDEPRTVAQLGERLVATCPAVDKVGIYTLDGEATTLSLDWGDRPFGAVAYDGELYVTLQGTGGVARISLDSGVPVVEERIHVIEDARGIAVLPGKRLGVTRWRSSDDWGRVAIYDLDSGETTGWWLEFDDQLASDTETGGVPSYLDPIAVSPTGDFAALPSLQANIAQGEYLNDEPLDHQSMVRAVVSFVDLETGDEARERRKLFDDRGLASAAVFSPRGDYLYVAMRGSRTIERYDMLEEIDAGAIFDVGFAPQGLALSPDGQYLFVDAYMSREVVVYKTDAFDSLAEPHARLQIPSSEPLSDEVLRGKQLFNDAFDPRLAKDSYIACAHCHLDGEADRRTWDFTDRGEGIRNTISLLGREGAAHGPMHWSGNFDEVHDFENDIRLHFGGLGLLDEADWTSGSTAEPLGDPKAGLSDDLDALAAYVSSLSSYPRSPYRTPDGSLTDSAARGKTIFESAETGCTDCHSGPRLTDSAWLSEGSPKLHDVGTLTDASGNRLGGELTGIDTPTLHGIWNSAPYLHDGSAATLRNVVTTRSAGGVHGKTSHLSEAEIDDLVMYLKSL
ncbi:PKD domain-containing protein [Persicimonas caeni]|uniref:PKD domain-containing protein n=1 Tax=Persicimonas caeni TaxID=2292766 RepID=UPI00164E12E0|nr:PKD domain-containing protein [Persicimonas caeni]